MTRRRGGSGCVFVIVTCLVACCFLLINAVLVATFFRWYAAIGPAFLNNDAVEQAVLFVGPVLLMFFEWWLVDYIVDRITPDTRSKRQGDKGKRADGRRDV